MPSVLLNQKEQELLNMKTVTLKNNRRWVQDLECSVLHRLTLATKIPRVLNKKHTVEKTMKKNRNKRVDFCLLSLTQYLPPHHLRPLSILFTELENTKNTVESTWFFFYLLTLSSACVFYCFTVSWEGNKFTEQQRQNREAKIYNPFDTIHRFNNHLNDVTTCLLLETHRFLREVFLNNW